MLKLKELVDELSSQMEEYNKYLNKETGEVVTVSTGDMSIAEEIEIDEDLSQYPDWQRDSIKEAQDILINWEKFIELPDKWEINEYSIMEKFCFSIENESVSSALSSAIRGKGAFSRFKDTLYRYGIEQKWYSFFEDELREIAIRWCEDEGIGYTD